MAVSELFEVELRRRGISFQSDGSGGYEISLQERRFRVSLDNLARDVVGDNRDAERVAFFVDQVVAASEPRLVTSNRLYWYLETNDYADEPAYRTAISPRVDRVLVHAKDDDSLMTWIAPDDLQSMGLSARQATERAWSNLDAELRRSRIETREVDGVTLGMLETAFPWKASLILAPGLREVVSGILGWPVLAVTPDRSFLYLWSADRPEFASRLGGVVIREFEHASYPLTTEVFEIGATVRAIGAFTPQPQPGSA